MSQQNTIGRTATTVYTENGTTKVRYHSTVVVEFTPETIILNSGGWHTATTKTRMNQAANQFGLNYRVFQKDFDWFVELTEPNGDTVDIEFQDGLELPRSKSYQESN